MTVPRTVQRLGEMALGFLPTLVFLGFAVLTLRMFPQYGIAALKLPVYALFAIATAHLVLAGESPMTATGAVAAPVIAIVLLLHEEHAFAFGRLSAALAVCGCAYLFLHVADTLAEAVIGGLIGLILGAIIARFCLGGGLAVSGSFCFLFLLLFVAARVNGRGPLRTDATDDDG